MKLTIENVYQILDFIEGNDNCSMSLDAGDITITVTKGNAVAAAPAAKAPAAPAAAAAPAAPAAAAPEAAPAPAENSVAASLGAVSAASQNLTEEDKKLVPITANVTSVFYRAPSPTEPAFVEVGDEVNEDTCVCLLEVMKCFYQTYAGVKGRIAKIMVNNADLVEAGTVLFLVDPE